MNNQEKLDALLSAISDIETFKDGSIRIQWKANVSHEVPGHLLQLASGLNVVKGSQVHFNPELSEAINQISFEDLKFEIDLAICEANPTQTTECQDCQKLLENQSE